MISTLPIKSAKLAAAVVSPSSKAVFSKGDLVLQGPDGEFLHVRQYLANGSAQGARLTPEDLEGLVRTGQAVRAESVQPMSTHTGVWVLRSHMPRFGECLRDLRHAAILVAEIQMGADGAWLCLVDESKEGSSRLLERWRDRALGEARNMAKAGNWRRAEREAAAAYALAPGLDARSLAMWALCLGEIGQTQRAKGLEAVAGNSRGPEFVEDMQDWLRVERAAISEVAPRDQRNDVFRRFISTTPLASLVGQQGTARLVGEPVCR